MITPTTGKIKTAIYPKPPETGEYEDLMAQILEISDYEKHPILSQEEEKERENILKRLYKRKNEISLWRQ